MSKAAYFVDNPDFDCLRGVAGYSQEEHDAHGRQEFPDHLSTCHFNKKVQSMVHDSYKKRQRHDGDLLKEIAPELHMKNPRCYSWPLKHDNVGILIYEIVLPENDDLSDCIHNGLHLLGFCALN